jgi:hypothetical protein
VWGRTLLHDNERLDSNQNSFYYDNKHHWVTL